MFSIARKFEIVPNKGDAEYSKDYDNILKAHEREEKIIVRHTEGNNMSSTVIHELKRGEKPNPILNYSIFTSQYDYYWTSVREGRLLETDYDRADREYERHIPYDMCPFLEKVGQFDGCMVCGSKGITERHKERLLERLSERNDVVTQAYVAIGKPTCNVYVIRRMVLPDTPHSTDVLRWRIMRDFPYIVSRHDHILPDILATGYIDEHETQEIDFLEDCGFTYNNGIYTKDITEYREELI